MEPVLFYGIPHGCSFGSIVSLEWSGEPYRLYRIDMLADPKDPLHARLNPLQETPAMMLEDGEILTESFAILHHIAARNPARQLGFHQGTRGFDRLNRALAYLHTSFHSAFSPLWTAYKLTADAPEQEMLRTMGREKVAKGYAYLENMLIGRNWLVGDGRTVADAYLAAIARWGEDLRLFDLKRDYPRLQDYLQKLEADKAVIFAHAIEDARPSASSGNFMGHLSATDINQRLAA